MNASTNDRRQMASTDTFRCPRWPWIGVALAGVVPFGGVLWRHPDLIPLHLAFLAVLLVLPLLTLHFVIGDDGMTLYRVNRLRWDEVGEAYSTRVLWLPYIVARKRTGVFRRWWIPLYFRGARDVRQSIIERCPADNPIRRYVEGGMDGTG